MPDEWSRLGSGAYNTVYINQERTLVLKIPHPLGSDAVYLDNAERSVRLWNEMNPDIKPKAQVYGYEVERYGFYKGMIEKKIGWTAPYIEGKEASDEEIAKKVLEIYARTGRIVVDACTPGNFIRTTDGKVVCVDIGLALKLEKEEEKNRSFASLAAWKREAHLFGPYFQDASGYRKTAAMIKALLVIQDKSPNLDVMRLGETDKDWVSRFAAEYKNPAETDAEPNPWRERAGEQISEECATATKTLEKRETALKEKKDFCDKRLAQYIRSRGSITYTGEFKPSIITRIFRNKALTAEKVAHAQDLRKQIQKAKDEKAISSILLSTELHSKGRFFKAGFLAKSDLEMAVKACQHEIEKMDEQSSELEMVVKPCQRQPQKMNKQSSEPGDEGSKPLLPPF